MHQLNPTPGTDRIAAAFVTIEAAAAELDSAVAVNRQQVVENNEHVVALNQQSTDLTAVADKGESVAASLRALLAS